MHRIKMADSQRYLLFSTIILLLYCGSARGSFFCLIPNAIRPGWPFTISVTATRQLESPVNVMVKLHPHVNKSNILANAAKTIMPGETQPITLQVPVTVNPGRRYTAHVVATGGASLDKTSNVLVNTNVSLVLVQTDKKIYKPGQKVRIRLLHMDKILKPILEPLTMTILNTKNNKIEQYEDLVSDTGVTEKIFQLSSNPSLGDWKIEVSQSGTILQSTVFIVEEFVLPKFSVEVKADPDFIISSAERPGTNIIVKSFYTHGKAVQGICYLKISHSRFEILVAKEISESGIAEFTDINWNVFAEQLDPPYSVRLEAEVKDETGRSERGEAEVMVYKRDIKISILEQSTRVLKPGMEAEVHIRVSDYAGNPVGPVTLQLSIVSKSLMTEYTKLTVAEGETDVSFKYLPNRIGGQSKGEIKVTLDSDKDISDYMSVSVLQTKTQAAIMVKSPDKPLKVGQEAVFIVMMNNTPAVTDTLSYTVVNLKNIIETGNVPSNKIRLTPTVEMCPNGKLIVYMIVGESQPEIIADSVDLNLEGCFPKQVDVNFEAAEVRTNTDVTMQVNVNLLNGSNALPGVHDVYYLAVDQSIVLLESSTDLDKGSVLSAFSGLAVDRSSQRPLVTTHQYFQQSGFSVMKVPALVMTEPEPEPPMEDGGINIDFADVRVMVKEDIGGNWDAALAKAESADPPSSKVRKNFPDTWLWGHAKTGVNGKLRTTVTTPDTITSWMISAFAMNQDGLAVIDNPFMLATTKLFFLTMNLPYSIKRGEIFSLRITVFNYRDKEVEATVGLEKSNLFDVLNGKLKDGWFEQTVTMAPNRASSVEFKINAIKIGSVEVYAKAEDEKDGQMDAVKRKLLVKPEGEERSRAITKALILDSESTANLFFSIPWPREVIVPDSQRVEVKITGDIFGQALTNLRRLISQPYGCGEQNMISTVPNIFGLQYIKKTDRTVVKETTDLMLAYMKIGYQREVDNYRHRDGSYSAWGEDGSPGSTWLTAFVIKSFCQASQFIMVDKSILTTGLDFLKSRQSQSGSFLELGSVIHTGMQGGTGEGQTLTVYVLIAMLEARQALGDYYPDLSSIIDKTREKIELINLDKLEISKDYFLASMTAYALSLLPERGPSTDQLIEKLLDIAIASGAPWEKDSVSAKRVAGSRKTVYKSQDVEITAYILLTYTRLNHIHKGTPLMKWLQEKQNSKGGYRSTQDTVMALQALADFGEFFTNRIPNAMVSVTEPVSGQSFNVDVSENRAILLQTVELPPSTSTVQVNVTGDLDTYVTIKVVYSYYTSAGDDDMAVEQPSLILYTKSEKLSRNVHKVEACVRSSGQLENKGMFVTTMTLPSGERAMEDTATIAANNPKVSRVEVEEEAIHFYLNEAPGNGYCLQAQLERELEFEVQKPGSAKIYAYYEPEISQEVGLNLETDAKICANNICDSGSAIMRSMTSVLLTVMICALVSLLICV